MEREAVQRVDDRPDSEPACREPPQHARFSAVGMHHVEAPGAQMTHQLADGGEFGGRRDPAAAAHTLEPDDVEPGLLGASEERSVARRENRARKCVRVERQRLA